MNFSHATSMTPGLQITRKNLETRTDADRTEAVSRANAKIINPGRTNGPRDEKNEGIVHRTPLITPAVPSAFDRCELGSRAVHMNTSRANGGNLCSGEVQGRVRPHKVIAKTRGRSVSSLFSEISERSAEAAGRASFPELVESPKRRSERCRREILPLQ